MAPRVSRQPRPPKLRARAVGDYFPAEVVRILGLQGIDYRQLRSLAKIACPDLEQSGSWSRYQFRDLIAIKTAFELAGGHAALRAGRRLRFHRVARACAELRERFGIADPLVQVRMEVKGAAIHVHAEGLEYRAADGQLSLLFDRARAYSTSTAAGGAPGELRMITEALRRERDDVAQAQAPALAPSSARRRARRTHTWPL
jgi:hypothetical protein